MDSEVVDTHKELQSSEVEVRQAIVQEQNKYGDRHIAQDIEGKVNVLCFLSNVFFVVEPTPSIHPAGSFSCYPSQSIFFLFTHRKILKARLHASIAKETFSWRRLPLQVCTDEDLSGTEYTEEATVIHGEVRIH